MKIFSEHPLATFLIRASMHSAQTWTGKDVQRAGAIVVLGQRLPCRDDPGRKPATKRICATTVRSSELLVGPRTGDGLNRETIPANPKSIAIHEAGRSSR